MVPYSSPIAVVTYCRLPLFTGFATGPQIAYGSGAQAVLDTDLNGPYGVAVDGSGNAFVADGGNGRVVKILAGGGTPITVASGLSYPIGVAVTGAGDVIITDNGTGLVLELPAGTAPSPSRQQSPTRLVWP